MENATEKIERILTEITINASTLTDEIHRLRAVNGELLAALKEIADICKGPAATRTELAHAIEESARSALRWAEGGTHAKT